MTAALAVLVTVPATVHAQQLTVSAAASLTDAFKALGAAFEASTSGARVRFNFAASGVLLQQIVQGAPVDVYASADRATMDRAAAEGLIDPTSRVDFAVNEVVLIEPTREATGLSALADLTAPKIRRIAIGKPASVPAGRYAREALERTGLWTPLEAKFVHADNVRQVLDYVARGEVDVGFVYRTDAAAMKDRVDVAFMISGHAPVTYPIAVVADSRHKELAGRFVAFLGSRPAREILTRFGFESP